MPLIVCERRFDHPLAPGDLEAVARRLAPCLARVGARHLGSLISPDGRRTICQFEAPDAEAVRLANRLAEAPFERAWAARRWPEGDDLDADAPPPDDDLSPAGEDEPAA